MKILIDAMLVKGQHSGVEHTIEALLEQLALESGPGLEIEAFINEKAQSTLRSSSHFRLHPVKGNLNNRLGRIWKENSYLPKQVRKEKENVCFHAPAYVLPRGISCPTVLTVHDLIALNTPQYCKNQNALYFGLWMPRSIRQADHIVAVSRTLASEICQRFQLPSEKVSVIHHGVRSAFQPCLDPVLKQEVSRKYQLPDKFVLFVGNLEPKKNIPRLLEAFHQMRSNSQLSHKLVVAGKKGWKYKPVFEKMRALKLEKEVHFIGYADQEDLPVLYTLADALAFPSLDEGFGLPPLEAMASGTPVMASNRGSLPETTNGIGAQVNPENIDEMARALHSLIVDEDFREKSIREGRAWARQFTWEIAAKKYLSVYRSMLKS